MDSFLGKYLGAGIAIAASVVGVVAAFFVYREINKSPEQRAAEKAEKAVDAKVAAMETRRNYVEKNADSVYGRSAATNFSDYLLTTVTAGLYVPPRLSGGPPVSVRGSILLKPSGKVILVNDIVASGGVINSRTDGTYDFRYNNQTYSLEETSSRADGVRIATLRPAGVTL